MQSYDICNSYTLQLVIAVAATIIYSGARAFWPSSCAKIAVSAEKCQIAIAEGYYSRTLALQCSYFFVVNEGRGAHDEWGTNGDRRRNPERAILAAIQCNVMRTCTCQRDRADSFQDFFLRLRFEIHVRRARGVWLDAVSPPPPFQTPINFSNSCLRKICQKFWGRVSVLELLLKIIKQKLKIVFFFASTQP